MPSKGWTTQQVRQVYAEALKEAYEAKKVDLIKEDINTFNKYLNEYILKGIAVQELTSRFTVAEYTDDGGIVKDRLTGKQFQVSMHKGRLWCETDETDDCVHIFYLKEDGETKKALDKNGYKLSQV